MEEWKALEKDIEEVDAEIQAIAQADEGCRRLLTVPGIGPIVATAMVAAIGNGSAFQKGREFATWMGLVPQQWSTGGKPKLLGISKRGNEYLRRLFIHGARSVVSRVKRERLPFGSWITSLQARSHHNVLCVAVANKLARIAWTVLNRQTEFAPAVVTGTPAERGISKHRSELTSRMHELSRSRQIRPSSTRPCQNGAPMQGFASPRPLRAPLHSPRRSGAPSNRDGRLRRDHETNPGVIEDSNPR